MGAETKVKICGITNIDDALAAVSAGADMLGFVCDENSPRSVTPQQFYTMRVQIPSTVACVGVFSNTTSALWRTAGPNFTDRFDLIQYYTDEVWPRIIGENWDMRKKIRAFAISETRQLQDIARYNGLTQSYLLNVNLNGTGKADRRGWEIACDVHQFGKRIYLAGGLTPENVALAARIVLPYAVDVTVGVESEPGRKDAVKMRDFIQAVKKR